MPELEQQLDGVDLGGWSAGLRAEPQSERGLRVELRRQIAALEQRLGELWASAFPRQGIDWRVGSVGGPRILGAAELERVRDALVVRISEAQAELARRADLEQANRSVLESMIAEPDRYRWVRVSGEDVGERGCLHWHSRPRWGILGMFLGWWRVKLSSGCPLAAGRSLAPPATPAPADVSQSKKRKKRPRRRAPASPAVGVAAEPAPRESRPKPLKPRATGRPASERPPAPWGSFPLVELVVLAGLILLVAGFVVGASRGVALIVSGLALASLGGLELSVREHFAGYRSHTVLLAGVPAIAVLGALFYLAPRAMPPLARLAVAAAVFAAVAYLLTNAFRKRAGVAFKLR